MKRNGVKFLVVITVMALVITAASSAGAATYTIPNNVDTVDGNGNYSFVKPGDTLLIPSSRTTPIWFQKLQGSAANWIKIRNTGGQVSINGAGSPDAVRILFSEYIHFSGTGASGVRYGFKINGGVAAWPHTRFFETDHIEIYNSSKAGFNAYNRYGTGGWHVPPTSSWTQKEISVHDCYIHNVGTEGMYLGHTLNGQGGVLTEGLYVYNNRLEHMGWEGIQMASAKGIECYNNWISDTHLSPTIYQPGSGILTLEFSDGHIYNNVIVRSRYGIQVQSGAALHKIYNNTIIDSEEYGLRAYVGADPGIEYYDNIITGYGSSAGTKIQSGTAYNNLIDPNPANIGFIDYASGDYHLAANSPAVDQGSSAGYAVFDFDGISRPQGNGSDIGAYEYGSKTNVLLNPSFERGNGVPQNWVKYGPGVTIAKSGAHSTDGSFSCRVTNRSSRYHGVRQNVINTIVNNKTYSASIDIRLDRSSDEVRLNLYSDGVVETFASLKNVPANTWVTIRGHYTTAWNRMPSYAFFQVWCANKTTSYVVDNADFSY